MQRDGCAPVVHIITMGCAKNEVDSDTMRAALVQAGFVVDKVASHEGASRDSMPDVVIVNTCSFITEATQESIDTILQIAAQRDDALEQFGEGGGGGGPAIVVTGCMPSRYGDELQDEIPEVDAFLNVADEKDIVSVVSRLTGWNPAVGVATASAEGGQRVLRTVRDPFAYVKISDGCDRFCSFCTIPYIRGAYHSRPARQILDEIDYLVAQGTREIVLIGQDTGVWGDDLGTPDSYEPAADPSLAALMECIASRHPDTWLRVMYLQPERVDRRLLGVIASHDNICSYLDVPLQHASAQVVRDMNRMGNGQEYLQFLQEVRELVPDVTLRTTMIAGFPGETDQQAQELTDFMERAGFDFAGVFEYSQEDGTPAGERPDQVPADVAVQRAQRVRDAADRCGFDRAQARVGKRYDVLLCGVADEDDEFGHDGESLWESRFDASDLNDDLPLKAAQHDNIGRDRGIDRADAGVRSVDVAEEGELRLLWGRAQFQAPEVDSVIYVDAPMELLGSIVPVTITGAQGYDLEGELSL